MIAVRTDVGEDHTHVNLLAWTEAHLELILSANIASSDAFLDRKLAGEMAYKNLDVLRGHLLQLAALIFGRDVDVHMYSLRD
jgi:hypothetical protein